MLFFSDAKSGATTPELRYPSPESSPMLFAMDVEDNEVHIELMSPLQLPATPSPSPSPIPQLAKRSESMEKSWTRQAADQAAIVGATKQFFATSVTNALFYCRKTVNAIPDIWKRPQTEIPFNHWDKLVPDGTWTPEVPRTPTPSAQSPYSVYSSDEDADGEDDDVYQGALNLLKLDTATDTDISGSTYVNTSDNTSPPSPYSWRTSPEPVIPPSPPTSSYDGNPSLFLSQGWNGNHCTSRDYVDFPIPSDSGELVNAPWIKHDLSPDRPLIHATLGPGCPIYARFLRPKCDASHTPAYTNSQKRLFFQEEPFYSWIEEALHELQDPSLTAGVYNYRWHRKQVKATEAALQSSMLQLGQQCDQAQAALKDLENANAFSRILERVKSLDAYHSTNLRATSHKTLRQIVPDDLPFPMDTSRATTSRHSRAPSPIHITSAPKRCYNCRMLGHIRRECNQKRKRSTRKYRK